MHTLFRLDGRKALVTGGASGIGEAVCRVLSGAGAMVTIVLIVTVAIGCAGSTPPDGTARTARTSAPTTTPITPGTHPRRALFVPAALTAKGLGLRAGPVRTCP